MSRYHLLHAAKADMLRRAGRHQEAAASYRRAATLADSPSQRRQLLARMEVELTAP